MKCGFGWLILLSTMTMAFPQPLVLVSGKYAEPHANLLEELGAKVQWVTMEQIAEGVGLDKAAMVLLAHTERPIPEHAQKMLANFALKGGILLLELTPFPAGELAPPSPHQFVSGWTPDIELIHLDDPLFAHVPARQKLWRYGAWGSGVFVDEAFTLAKWTFPPERTFAQLPTEIFRKQPAAIARWKLGKGQIVFVGAATALIGSTKPLARALHIALLGEEQLPIIQLTRLIEFPIKPAENAQDLKTQLVGIFREPNFPRIGLPDDVTPEFIASALHKHGISATFLSASDLASPTQLNAKRINTLVLSYGPTVPLDALPNIKRFLAEGGGLVSPAGIPMSMPVKLGSGQISVQSEPDVGTVMTLFRNLLPFAKAYKARKLPRYCVVLRPDLLPNLPKLWHLSGGQWAVIPVVNGSQHLAEPIVASISDDGDVVALPLVFAYRFRQYPCARIIALGFYGESHPWSRKAWEFAEAAIADIVRLALRRDYIAIRDLMSDQPCYLPNETVTLTAELVCPIDISAHCRLLIRERDTGQVMHQAEQKVTLKGGEPQTLTFQWRIPSEPHWAYDAILTAETQGKLQFHERTMFLVRSDGTMAMVRRAKPYRREMPNVGWLSGINLYTNDPRGIGAYFDSEQRLGKHPLPDIWDREISLVRLYGGNAVRQHYYERILNEQVFANDSYNWAKRVLDANHILLALHDVAALTDPFTFSPEHYWRKRLGEGDPYVDKRWLQAEEAYLRGLASWLADFPNVAWELINEPEGYGREAKTSEERRFFAERVAEWCKRMSQAIFNGQGFESPIGIGLAWAPSSPIWSVRHFLNFMRWSHAHHYQPTLGEGVWTLPFALAYGRPCIIGEAGMPNAENSPHPFLREWGEIYEQMLHIVLGEQALGFTNFYLNNPLQHPEAPEWGMMRHDGTEREACRVWAKWNFVLRHLDRNAYLLPPVAILTDTESLMQSPAIIREMRDLHMQLLESGVPSTIVSEHDLQSWLHLIGDKPERWRKEFGVVCLVVPKGAKPSDKTWDLVRKLKDIAAKAGTDFKVAALCEPRPEWALATLPEYKTLLPTGFSISPHLTRLVYPLRKRDGGLTVVLVDGRGVDGEIVLPLASSAFKLRVRLTVPKGRCSVIDVDQHGDLRLISAYGSVALRIGLREEETLVQAPKDVAWVIAGKITFAGSVGRDYLDLWCDNQRSLEIHVPAKGDLKWWAKKGWLKQVTIYASPQFADVAQIVAQSLREIGASVKLVKRAKPPFDGNAVVIDDATQNHELAKLVADMFGIHFVGHEGWSFWRKGTMRIWQPWSGLILSKWDERDKRWLIVITGHTEASVRVASLKFRTLRSLGNYCAAPFCSL